MVIHYRLPDDWIRYDRNAVMQPLLEAKAAMLALTQIPYQRSWADDLQRIQLKREVAGTSKIEGAEFTEKELDAALKETPEHLETRSQRQAAAAVSAYRWIATLPPDQPLTEELIFEIHRRLIFGCDDDHCPPGQIRGQDQNVTFGAPRHRGVSGGDDCRSALRAIVEAQRTVFAAHDPLIQSLAMHYHFAAMHPFLDGNGRTARAIEALMLQRVGLRDTLFIAMSNYYYEEKTAYLQSLSETRARSHNLTPFLIFGLRGIESQCRRLFAEIRQQLKKALFRNTVAELFGRLKSPRKRVVSGRHIELLNFLLDVDDKISSVDLQKRTKHLYSSIKNPDKAIIRDLMHLWNIDAIEVESDPAGPAIRVNLEWPKQITESTFLEKMRQLPKARIGGFFSSQ